MTSSSDHRNPRSTPSVPPSTVAGAPPTSDPLLPLHNLAALGHRIGSIRQFLSDAVDGRKIVPENQLAMISQEIGAAAQQIILNGAALLAFAHPINPSISASSDPAPLPSRDPQFSNRSADLSGRKTSDAPVLEVEGDAAAEDDEDCEIVEIDEAELMAEHVHFCEICGKGFKRDANLRMHMRAHGNQYKTLEALSKPDRDRTASLAEGAAGKKVRFSCPFVGCNRNKGHKKFRPLKSAVCVKNHFKRSHCPKMYSCHRCNKKNFSVLADLRNHIKHCGESRWRCSCGTTFSRKDKLFGHIALFDGHMPAVVGCEEEGIKSGVVLMKEEEKGKGLDIDESDLNVEGFSSQFFKDMVEEFDEIERGNWMSS